MPSSFWDQMRTGAIYFDKDALAQDETPLRVTGVFASTGKYGPQWTVDAVRLDTSEAGRLSFTSNQYRDSFFTAMREAVKEAEESGEMFTAIVTVFQTNSGFQSFGMGPVPSDAQQEIPF